MVWTNEKDNDALVLKIIFLVQKYTYSAATFQKALMANEKDTNVLVLENNL